MRLKRNFFNRTTPLVARELLGKYLCRQINPSRGSGQAAKIIRARITETEAYCGEKDLACHSSKRRTKRTEVMFGPSGHAYIYLIYGMYHCFNVVTREEGKAEAVLIRAAEFPISKNQFPKTTINGPGKLCRELGINRNLNGIDITKSNLLWFEEGREKINPFDKLRVKKSKRIGVDYAGKWKDKLWRFYI